jgi:hypothetical protein
MLAFELIDDLLLCYHDASAPSDDEWQAAMKAIESHRGSTMRALILTLGGAPTPSQQLRIARMKERKSLTVAVVSSSIGIRFVASSLALLTRQIRTFAPHELKRAYDFLDLGQAHEQQAERFFRQYPLST